MEILASYLAYLIVTLFGMVIIGFLVAISVRRFPRHTLMMANSSANHIINVNTLAEANALFWIIYRMKNNILIMDKHPKSFFINLGTSLPNHIHYEWHCDVLKIGSVDSSIEYEFTNPIVFYWIAWKFDKLRKEVKKNVTQVITSTYCIEERSYVTDDFDFDNYLYKTIAKIEPINTK